MNAKKTAAELYNLVQGEKYHLSANMTPAHRSRVIEVVRNKLENGEHITVVSTSLVEAGVDLDFNTVFRQLSVFCRQGADVIVRVKMTRAMCTFLTLTKHTAREATLP